MDNPNPNPNLEIILTRYLYLKDEVEVVLLMSILNKKESAVFWAYELYYSGFEEELFTYLFQIYYDFYYVLNPGFQQYLITKYKEWKKYNKNSENQSQSENSEKKDIIVSIIIQNLLSRSHNTDIYRLRTQNETRDTNIPKSENNFSEVIKLRSCPKGGITKQFLKMKSEETKEILVTGDATIITSFIMSLNTEMEIMTTLEIAVDYFNSINDTTTIAVIHLNKVVQQFVKAKDYYVQNIQLLAWIIHEFAKIKGLTMGKNIYVSVEPCDILVYETILKDDINKIKSHHILSLACMYSIGENDYLSLFPGLERNKISFEELQKKYWYHWLYYASFSPIWFKRIEKYKGKIVSEKENVLFLDEDLEEEFYQHFGYEPDEQKREIQDRNIPLL